MTFSRKLLTFSHRLNTNVAFRGTVVPRVLWDLRLGFLTQVNGSLASGHSDSSTPKSTSFSP
ncbi:hypothetical protein E2C01_096840 [Portunus trituberculatus]|uniref:Uncharacterized protein n=1 Tax=Portunus trituberculatus TaxID=210409 RepID=A0A5B7K2T9_PORTR|nr:hypothetical protein [Portunus trituberculatus]